jgi:hypothetical protein
MRQRSIFKVRFHDVCGARIQDMPLNLVHDYRGAAFLDFELYLRPIYKEVTLEIIYSYESQTLPIIEEVIKSIRTHQVG